MRLRPTTEELDLAETLRRLFVRECPPSLVRELAVPGADRFPHDLWSTMVSAGLLGLPFPEEHGGSGGTLEELGVLHVEAGRALCPTVVESTMAFGLAVDLLGNDAQRSGLLPRVCAGDLRGTIALSNPADADDVRPRLRSAACKGDSGDEAGDHLVSGTLEMVADADLADVLMVSAAGDSDHAPGPVLGLLVDLDAAGVSVEPTPTIAGHGSFRLVLDDVRVPADSVLSGADGLGLDEQDLRRVAHIVTALQCLDMVGGAEAVVQRTVEHTSTRHQFGRPIGSFQAVQHLVADMHIAVQGARLASRSAVFWLGRGLVATRETAVARMHAAAAYKRVTLDAHQLHGGMGYVLETDLHLWSARARHQATIGGTADTAARWLEEEIGLVR